MTIYQKFVDKNIKYGSYDFKSRKDRRSQKINKEIARDNLLIFRNIFKNHELKFFLLYGTVLGAIRENDFIAHDTDTDVGIFEEDRHLFLNAIPILLKNGFKIIRTKEPDDLVTFMRNDEYIDVGIFSLNGRYYKYQDNLIDKKFLERLDSTSFLGFDFYIPSNIEKFLVKNYGSNWMEPLADEPALQFGIWNKYYLFKRILIRTRFGKVLKTKINKFIKRI
jgi:lipopolysaccharide cholinephosphotransferase